MKRSSGILMAVSSLPSPYGIGTLGQSAYDFADFLHAAGQRYWQMLPLGPTSYGDSPYQSFSTYAGNPYYIDPELLIADGLLTKSECSRCKWGGEARHVDYGRIYEKRFDLLRKAFKRGWQRDGEAVAAFVEANERWLPDYALFMACKRHFGMKAWTEWPDDIRLRKPEALEKYRALLREDVDFFTYLQYLFFRQWERLRDYVHAQGIRIIGDLPIYVSPDSAEVWGEPGLFQVDEDYRPSAVAGVPPDAFSADGQLWGNPLYDWERHRETGFAWWKRRAAHMARLYDMVRIDHFRAFHTYWNIPLTAESAKEGHWEPGPGMELLRALETVPGLELIAEDLGDLDADARAFIAESGLPGMKILVYAFDPAGESAYLPHNCPRNSVVYTGTHDTPTFVQWLFDEATPAEREYAFDYLTLREDEGFGWGGVRGAWAAPSLLAIAPMQDLLGLGADARINAPGTMGPQNWSWRVRQDAFNRSVSARLRKLTRTYRRCL